jgi:hypothetical protein
MAIVVLEGRALSSVLGIRNVYWIYRNINQECDFIGFASNLASKEVS